MDLNWLFPTYSTCLVCGKEDGSSLHTGFCREHHALLPVSSAPGYVFDYVEPIRGLIHSWKYQNKRYLSRVFADLMQEKLSTFSYDVLTFVPMTAEKKKLRGYNQVELLCRELDPKKTQSLLEQKINTPSQTELNYRQRLANRLGVYRLNASVKNRHILLIDDVRTTGATLAECRNVLLLGGASSVDTLTFSAGILQDEHEM